MSLSIWCRIREPLSDKDPLLSWDPNPVPSTVLVRVSVRDPADKTKGKEILWVHMCKEPKEARVNLLDMTFLCLSRSPSLPTSSGLCISTELGIGKEGSPRNTGMLAPREREQT